MKRRICLGVFLLVFLVVQTSCLRNENDKIDHNLVQGETDEQVSEESEKNKEPDELIIDYLDESEEDPLPSKNEETTDKDREKEKTDVVDHEEQLEPYGNIENTNEQRTENISVPEPVTVENETKETAEEPETSKNIESGVNEKNTIVLTEDESKKKQMEEDIPEETTVNNQVTNEPETDNGVSSDNQTEGQQEQNTEKDTERPDEAVSQTTDYHAPEITEPVEESEENAEKQPETPPEEQVDEQSTEKDSDLNEGDMDFFD